jgi:hypothetical protein
MMGATKTEHSHTVTPLPNVHSVRELARDLNTCQECRPGH